MKKIIFFLVFITCQLSCFLVYAQSISGIVTDQTKEAVEFANVILYQIAAPTEPVQLVGTDSTGYYDFGQVNRTDFFLVVSAIGYNTLTTDTFRVEKGIPIAFNCQLEAVSYMTEGVVVTSKRPKIINKGGKTIVDFQNTLNNGSNLVGVLKKLPSVIVSKNSITIGGQSVNKILINGKNMNHLDIQNLLQNMSGENIAKVEMIYQADATFEASGSGPILNIILKKNKLKGTNGFVNGMIGRSNSAVYSNGAGLSSFLKKLSFNINGSYRSSNWSELNKISRQIGDESYEQKSENFYVPKTLSLNGGLDYYIHPNHTIGMTTQFSKHQDDWTGSSSIVRSKNGVSDVLNTDLFTREGWNFITLNPYYEWKWKKGFIRLDIRYLSYNSTEENDFIKDANSSLNIEVPNYVQNGDNVTWSHKLDVSRSLGEYHNLKVGTQIDLADLDNSLNHFRLVNDMVEPDPALDNQFLIDEDIVAAYVQYGFEKEKFELNAGLRWEESTTIGKSTKIDSMTERNIKRLFPSVSLSFPFIKTTALQLSYSHRINRPNYSSLNPFRVFYDPLFSDTGNPALVPEYVHSLQFRLLNKGSQLFRLVYSRKNNSFFERVFQDDASGETNRRLVNIDHYNFVGASCYFSVNYTENAYSEFSISGRFQNYTSSQPDFIYSNSLWSAVASHDFGIEFPKDISLEGSFWFGSGRLNGIQETDWYAGGYLEVSRAFFKNKLRMSLEVEDIINRGFVHRTNFQNINMELSNSWNFFNFFLRFRYSFGTKYTKDSNTNKRRSDGSERF